MRIFASIAALAVLIATPALADSAFPDLRGVWKGESESIVSGSGNQHHNKPSDPSIKLSSVPFTLKIDMEDGRRFSGTFSSPRSTEPILGVISNTGAIYVVDTDGYTIATLLAPDRLEFCYMQSGISNRIASCTVLTKQPWMQSVPGFNPAPASPAPASANGLLRRGCNHTMSCSLAGEGRPCVRVEQGNEL